MHVSQVMSELSAEEEEFILNVAGEQRPVDARGFIPDLPYLDKCLQQGRTLTSIKGTWRLIGEWGGGGKVLNMCGLHGSGF